MVMWDSLGFSGSLGECDAAAALDCGADMELLTVAPPSTAFFSSSFTLLGLHTTSETIPSVFFSKEAAWKTKLTICSSVLCVVSHVDRQQDGGGLPSHSLNPGACPCSQLESYLLQWGLPATQALLIMNINICRVYNTLCTVNTQHTSRQDAIITIRLYLATCFGRKRPSSGQLRINWPEDGRLCLKHVAKYNLIVNLMFVWPGILHMKWFVRPTWCNNHDLLINQ